MGDKESSSHGVEDEVKSKDGKNKDEVQKKKEFIPPDGGYGWVIVLAAGLSNFCLLPLIQNFGLLYRNKLKDWDISTAEYSFLMNFQFSVCNCAGLIIGPLLRTYGYRPVSLCGTILISISAIWTSQMNKFYLFVFSYSVLGGLGIGLGWSATSLAVNTYFKKRRGIAVGFSWTATGLSPVVFPHLLTWLRTHYDVHGTALILSGIMCHSIIASLLLHPVEWHTKPKVITEEKPISPPPKITVIPEEGEELKNLVENAGNDDQRETKEAVVMVQMNRLRPKSHHDIQIRRRHSTHLTTAEEGTFLVDTQSTLGLEVSGPVSLHSSRWSLASGESGLVHTKRNVQPKVGDPSEVLRDVSKRLDAEESPTVTNKKTFLRRVTEYLDLNLLSNPSFLMIFIGLTLANSSEINFTLLSPFVLSDFGFPMETVALFMSILASMDLVTRFIVPFITDHYKLSPILMLSIGLTILATSRMMLAHLSGFYTIIGVCLWAGFGKGLRTVNMALVMPTTVPLEKLPSASGLVMLANGIFFFIIGPLFGYIRDTNTDYVLALHLINVFTFGAIFAWFLEMMYTRNRRKSEDKQMKKKKKKDKTYYFKALVTLK